MLSLLWRPRPLVPLGIELPTKMTLQPGAPVRFEGRVLTIGQYSPVEILLEGNGISLRLPESLPCANVELAWSTARALDLPPRMRRLLGRLHGGEDGPSMPGAGDGEGTQQTKGRRENGAALSHEPAMCVGLLAECLEGLAYALALGKRIEEAAWALVGLGAGATPSGDDMLVGAMAAADRFREFLPAGAVGTLRSALRHVPPAATTQASRFMLWHAVQGDFVEPLRDVVLWLGSNEECHGRGPTSTHGRVIPLPLAQAVGALLELGAQSGQDMLAGVLAVVEAASRHCVAQRGSAPC